ncbi:UNVERIFIED_CONTAM: hypothetical protein K2H54_037553 [Gekko kuhli]
MDTPVRPLVFVSLPPLVKPNFKRCSISNSDDEEFVPTKLHFPSPVFDEKTRSSLNDEITTADTQPGSEVSQTRHGVLGNPPDYQDLISTEISQSQALTGNKPELPQLIYTGPREKLPNVIPAENIHTQEPLQAAASVAMSLHERLISMRNLLCMEIDKDIDSIPPQKHKVATRTIVRAMVYSILKHHISK